MSRVESTIALAPGADLFGPRPVVDDANADRRIEDWVVSAIGKIGPGEERNEWEAILGRMLPGRRFPKKNKGEKKDPADWSRFRMERSGGITIIALTDKNLIKEQDLGELAGDLLALVEAGHHRIILDFSLVERLSSWSAGTVAEAVRKCNLARGGALKVCGLRPEIASVFKITGLANQVAVYPDERSAVESPWPLSPEYRPIPVAVLSALTSAEGGPKLVFAPPARRRVRKSPLAEGHPTMTAIKLVIETGPNQGKAIAVTDEKVVIGRDASCRIRLSATAVSRFHASIERRDGEIFVRDLGSTNGTLHNGQLLRAEEVELIDGDRIQVGTFRLRVSFDAAIKAEANVEALVVAWVKEQGESFEDDTRNTLNVPVVDEVHRIKYEVIQDVTIITPLMPDLDHEPTIALLRNELRSLFDQATPRRVVVDLAHVGHLTDRAIGVLVAHHLKLDQTGGALRICRPNPRVAAVLDQVRLTMLVECHPTLDDAVLTPWPEPADSRMN